MAEKTLNHTWTRSAWIDQADASIGPLIEADRAGILEDIAAGKTYLYHVTGPVYGGWFLFRFVENHKGETVAFVIAFNGRNAGAGLPYLAELVRQAGAVELVCVTEQEAVARLYRGQGWKITEYELTFDLRKEK